MRYATLRKIHGLTGVVLAAALALYATSGWMIINNAGIGRPKVERLRVPVEPVGGRDESPDVVKARAVAAVERAGLQGAVARRARFVGDGWRVRVARVAHSAEVRLSPGASEALVERWHPTFGAGITGFHHISARDASGLELLWVALIDALALAILVFAWTGLKMFLALKRDRRLGWVLLGVGSSYTLGGILWLALLR